MKRYWLFKAEPDVYGIDHLAAEKNQTGRWDGIRNYQARNFLRDQVSLDDEVLLYHSQCKHIGVVGTAPVVTAAAPGPTQFTPGRRYYAPKASAGRPRWFSGGIRLQEKFTRIIR